MDAETLKEEVLSWLRYLPTPDWTTTQGERGVVVGLMNQALRLGEGLAEGNLRRHAVLAWLFRDYLNKPSASFISSKELPEECIWALVRVADAMKDASSGQWLAAGGFTEGCVACWQAMVDWKKEMDALVGEIDLT